MLEPLNKQVLCPKRLQVDIRIADFEACSRAQIVASRGLLDGS